ncbi:protoporphyrinogen oxidase [Colletotrichum lupini]|nr:protoporphyrinogen oxidase [Colletotrichum lupini]
MVLRRADDAFMALLRSYHSQRFCSAALGGCGRSAAAAAAIMPARRPFSTTTVVARQERRRSQKEAEPIFTKNIQVPTDIAVVGSGIAGLTTAHYLAKLLPETSNITIYEAGDRVGGWINTQELEVEVNGKKNNVRFERGPRTLRGMGKDTWKFDDLVLFDMIRDLQMQGEYLGIKSPPRYIYYPDHLVEMHPRNVFREAAFKGIIPGFLNLMWRRQKAREEVKPADMSVADFIATYTGRSELTNNLASAMIHGIWGGNADKLSMRSFMPGPWHRFFDRPYKEDDFVSYPRSEVGIMATLGQDQELRQYLTSAQKDQLVFFEKGMSSLPNTIAEHLRRRKNVTFKMGEPVTSLEYDNKGKKVMLSSPSSTSPTPYDKVISTTTSKALHAATGDALPSLANSPNVSIMAVNLWYPQPNLNAAHPGVGYLVPRATDSNLEGLLGVFFDSDVVPRAPDEPEGTKFFVLMGGHYFDGLPDDALPTEAEGIEMAKAVVERHLGIPQSTPAFAMANLAKDCIPQHHVGHYKRMAHASYELRDAFQGQLTVAGGSYTGIGVMGALRAGYDVAVHIAQSAQEHVGDTGLGQFEGNTEIFSSPRWRLRNLGRDIDDQIGWRNYIR